MHGLVNRSLQCFLRDVFGTEAWRRVAAAADAPPEGFEPLLRYDDAVTLRLIAAAAATLGLPRDSLLEDLGTYLVSHPNRESLRRLLRFGGVSFLDFLHSIDDLPERGRLALPDLDLPQIELRDAGEGRFVLFCRGPWPDFATVLVGVLRAMADDYGTLALFEQLPAAEDGSARIGIELLDPGHAAGRRFELAAGAV